jgi:hypothetical protein
MRLIRAPGFIAASILDLVPFDHDGVWTWWTYLVALDVNADQAETIERDSTHRNGP